MKKKLNLLVMLVCLLAFFTGCLMDTGGGTGNNNSNYPYAEYFPKRVISPTVSEKPHIKIYFEKIGSSYIWENATAFSVTVGGVAQSLGTYKVELIPPPFNTVGIWFSNNLPSSGDIKVSYDGSGVLAGKLEAFSDMPVLRK
jgi:hypothetical protein